MAREGMFENEQESELLAPLLPDPQQPLGEEGPEDRECCCLATRGTYGWIDGKGRPGPSGSSPQPNSLFDLTQAWQRPGGAPPGSLSDESPINGGIFRNEIVRQLLPLSGTGGA